MVYVERFYLFFFLCADFRDPDAKTFRATDYDDEDVFKPKTEPIEYSTKRDSATKLEKPAAASAIGVGAATASSKPESSNSQPEAKDAKLPSAEDTKKASSSKQQPESAPPTITPQQQHTSEPTERQQKDSQPLAPSVPFF